MINKCIIAGRLVYDLEVKRTPNEVAVINNMVAVDREKKNSQGEKVADFIPFTVWGKSAEYLYNYGAKGDLIVIQGSLRIDSYQTSDGSNKKKYYINSDTINIIFNKRKEQVKEKEKNQEEIDNFLDLYVDNNL